MSENQYKKRIIISDTSCLIGLTNIGLLEILRQLYETVHITPEVAKEYGESLPDWICITAVSDIRKIAVYHRFIDLGESSAIALATEIEGALLIVDDLSARQFAMSLGLEITGPLGVLLRAYKKGIITDIHTVIAKLRENGFRLPANTDQLIL
jgi:predicted nucleic acid-binding protein